ncbi:uncharacterized protein [Lolium perenne]|uniref:uncharacterized protein n=1 Tax=Lolium perenne TaxID=4522 RepID=UPI0021EA36B6|nr:uncharacterized protein LOC127312674 [Lolium perenne]
MRAGDSSRMERPPVQPDYQPRHHHHGRTSAEADDRRRHRKTPRIRDDNEQRSSGWVWLAVILCTLLMIGVIVAGATVFAVYLIYKPKMPYMVVTDARLGRLVYTPADGVIRDIQVNIGVLARNTNSKADATFSNFDITVGFHGADLALLRARQFTVARDRSVPLPYDVVSGGARLNAAGMQAMEGAIRAGVLPLDVFGKARTRWKMGIFLRVQFWTRISCRLYFNYPGNGTAWPIDRHTCRSRSP